MASESQRERLPFEPKKNKKNKPPKTSPKVEAVSQSAKTVKSDASLSAIPDVVSKRMAWRMAVCCGIPTALGMSSFVVFYWLRVKEIIELPPYAVLLVSLGFLGLGVIGLSYGIFSASWDENQPGSFLGVGEFKTNLGRTIEAWRASRRAKKAN
jgi:hypothetical protein